jgi:hypothetical protein
VVVRHIHIWQTHNDVQDRVTALAEHTAPSSQGTTTPVRFRIFTSLYNNIQLGRNLIAILTI